MRILGLAGSGSWAWLARCLLSGKEIPGFSLAQPQGRLVLVLSDPSSIEDIVDAFAALAPLAGGPDACLAAVFGEDVQTHLSSLERLRAGARLVLATPAALTVPTINPGEFKDAAVAFKPGTGFKRAEVLAALERAGYRRVDFVESPGEYAARGAVVDFFGLEPLAAVRVFFDEDVVESVRRIDPATQRTEAMLDGAVAIAARRPAESATRLSDWIGTDSLWVVEEGLSVEIPSGARLFHSGGLSNGGTGEGPESDVDFGARPQSPCRSRPEAALTEMERLAAEGFKVVLYSLNRGEDQRVQELLEGRLKFGDFQFLIGPLRQGFHHAPLKLAIFSTSEIFERNYRPSVGWKYFSSSSRGALRVGELKGGDYVVHQDYGIARYRGLSPVESLGHGVTDCLVLEFRGSDTLYVPMTEFRKVQKYSGSEGHRPRLSSLDTRQWEEVKRLVHSGVRELAAELLKLEAERKVRPGFAFPPLSPMEREFAAAFPYEETPDQARAIAEVLADMTAPSPMERLVVGDVGFGKTEVAMRAAFKCAAGYKQAAVLVPTTILADQHFRTFRARLADYPVRVGLLSRFQNRVEQKKTLAALAAGALDIVIGTTALLQKKTLFKDLGLVIVDEEHRFGVVDKERLKQIRANVDFLSLSATPIPRTLHQAYSGIKSISLIQSAPTGRQPIVTRVLPYDSGLAAQAISEELARGGQAYYVHNRVRTLPECRQTLQKLLPQARFAMVHGQMKASQIEEVMEDFFNRRYDVLVASSIIESGLDIPTVNALLIEDAHEFGLAQLYQLRGRIGRERQKAVCTLFYPSEAADLSSLTPEAKKRLEALKEFGELGSGFRLAMRDLEIRGAGDLLGARQHGYLNAVGVEYYTQLLNEELNERKGKTTHQAPAAVTLDLALPAYLPEDYLPGELARLEFYKKILRASAEELAGLRRELEELSGPLPAPGVNLFEMAALRDLAQRAAVSSITQKARVLTVVFRSQAPIDAAVLAGWAKAYAGRYRLVPSPAGDGLEVALAFGETALSWVREFLDRFPAAA